MQNDIFLRSFRRLLLLLVVSFASAGSAFGAFPNVETGAADTAGVSSGPHPLDTIWCDIGASVGDMFLLFSSPARFDPLDWAIAGGALAGVSAISPADEWVRERFLTGHTETTDHLATAGNSLGTTLPISVAAVGIYTGGLVFDAPDVRLAGRRLAQSLVYSALVTTTLKVVIGRQRPFIGEGAYIFRGPSFKDLYNSFPSGHTTVAFAAASSLSASIDHPAATVLLYGAATLTAAGRIYSDRHWLSDTFLGAAIGTACGYGVAHLHDPEENGGSSLRIVPAPDGIGLVWTF